jgi:excisionase family DNA binding protein
MREILSVREAAEYMGVSASHLGHILDGRVKDTPPIPSVRAGRRRLIRRSVIDTWLQEQERSASHGILSPTRIDACVSGGIGET